MDIQVTCPSCGQNLVVDSAATGQQVSCPTCSTPFVIPAVARVASASASATTGLRTRGTAVLSLVLGISSLVGWVIYVPIALLHLLVGCLLLLVLCLAAGVLAIVLGHQAHGLARKMPDQYAGRGMAIAGFIMGYVSLLGCGVVILLAMLLPAMRASSPEADAINSKNNLTQIGLAFRIWAGDHNDQYPLGLSPSRNGIAPKIYCASPKSHATETFRARAMAAAS